MAYRGKIACYFPEYNPQNYNVDDIEFLPVGGGENDLLYIDKVYALPAGELVSSVSDLEKYIVWEKISKILVAGTQHVAIEYIPSQDISVTDIGIFTNENSTGRQPHVKIFHESGLCVASTDGDVQTTNQEVYGLNGSNHDAIIQATTLKSGKKYYIVYSPGYGGGSTFYPAYFKNTNGNYKVYENETSTSQTTIVDISSFGNNLGNCSDIAAFIDASENDYMLWSGNLTGYTSNTLYVRSAVQLDGTYVGKIGTGQGLNATVLLTIGQLDENDIFMWDTWNSDILEHTKIYQRNSLYPKDKFKKAVDKLEDGYDVGEGNIFTCNQSFYEMACNLNKISTLTSTTEIRKTVECLMQCNDTTTMHLIVPPLWYVSNRILRRKVEGGISKLSATPLTGAYTTETLGAANDDIMFVNSSFTYNDVRVAGNETIVKYDITTDSFIVLATEYNPNEVWDNIFEIITSGLYIQHSVSDVLNSGTIDFTTLSKASYTPDTTFLNATVNTDKKFYLKLNGHEV